MNKKYHIFFDNRSNRVILNKNCHNIKPQPFKNIKDDRDFEKKINELSKYTDIKLNNEQVQNQPIQNQSVQNRTIQNQPIQNRTFQNTKYNLFNNLDKKDLKEGNNILLEKKNIIYGIKKTILSDFNYLNYSSNNNDFSIGINKNNKNQCIYDCFYLFPNISEINTKNETNIINEKKVEIFKHSYYNTIQYFPIDFIPCGITIPLKSKTAIFTKLIIKNIFWNIFQSINIKNYSNNELLSIVPDKSDFIYKNVELEINFELHSQVSQNIIDKYNILPYKNLNIRNATPANSCLFDISNIKINTLNGSYFDNLEINLLPNLDIHCALLCIKISVPESTVENLKGFDKNNNIFYGNIPFSQFILNFDYELC